MEQFQLSIRYYSLVFLFLFFFQKEKFVLFIRTLCNLNSIKFVNKNCFRLFLCITFEINFYKFCTIEIIEYGFTIMCRLYLRMFPYYTKM